MRRRIVKVKVEETPKFRKLVTLDCGHVRDLNPIFSYAVGDFTKCFSCEFPEGDDK